MRILLTNNTLASRAGSELYIRDIAMALLARGHQPIAYSRHLGDVAQELRKNSVVVVDDLAELHQPPDIIHAQHHLEAMTALTRYPHVPAVYVCHGWLPPEEAPINHPRIYRYIAVDELVKLRLVEECGVPDTMVRVHLNFVDLARFQQRRPLPLTAQRALAFSNYINDSNILPALRAACAHAGIQLDALGATVGNAVDTPETVLGEYDIVFAKGRAALEACAVGAAVIACDAAGIGEMVSTDSLKHFRDYNFGLRLLRNKVTVEAVAEQLERYNATDTSAVTDMVRADIGIDLAIEKLELEYRAAIEAHGQRDGYAPDAVEQEARAVSAYLRHGPLHGDFSKDQFARLNQQIGKYTSRVQLLEEEAQGLNTEIARFKNMGSELRRENESLQTDAQQLRSELASTLETANQKLAKLSLVNQVLGKRLRRIERSLTWRIRNRIVSVGWIKRLYRACFR